MGSGTIPVLAAMRQHEAVGFDLDPLAVLIAQAWGRPLIVSMFMRAAREVAHSARDLSQDPTMNTADRLPPTRSKVLRGFGSLYPVGVNRGAVVLRLSYRSLVTLSGGHTSAVERTK